MKLYSEEFSLEMLNRLRENVNDVHTELNDGEKFLHLVKYQAKLNELQNDDRTVDTDEDREEIRNINKFMRLKFEEFDSSSFNRVKQT